MIMPEGPPPPLRFPSAPLVPPCKTRRAFGAGFFDGILLVAIAPWHGRLHKIGMKYAWQPLMTSLKDDPSDIAKYLIQDNGIDLAIQMADDGITKAQQDGDNYVLSVWREVKTILRNKKAGPKVRRVNRGG